MTVNPRNLAYLAIILALLLHGALLPFTYGQTYDAYIHIFFADHYNRQWFNPWENRWYTGFTVTAYPPGSHQSVALLMNFMDMRAAFVTVMTGAVTLLIIGVYRFSQIWVHKDAAALAALLAAFSTSIAETVHIFGQLPTIFSIALFLNAMPHMSRWIEKGGWKELALALCFTAGATSAHHVTPLFGTLFFVAPIGLAAWIANLKSFAAIEKVTLSRDLFRRWMKEPFKEKRVSSRYILWSWMAAPARGMLLGLCMLVLIIGIVFPYWYWSITDPITQVSIPHGSRESFIEKPNLGLIFFVIPWGLLIFALPYVVAKLRTPLWPLGVSILFALLLGTGGTTPIPKLILSGAFDILTLDRFTFWATLLILPIAGLLAYSLLAGSCGRLLGQLFGELGTRLFLVGIFTVYALGPVAVALLPKVQPTQPNFVDPAPIVKFMDEDGHNQWRYLTLGLGDQFAYHSALINAESVDGNYNSARRLPSLTNYAVERLENSKYAGVPGLASLNQFLTNADRFHLKYVFSNDEYYDPLLHYTGWNPVVRLSNGLMVWEKANVPPLPDVRPKRALPTYQIYWWGILPITGLCFAFLAFIYLAVRGRLVSQNKDGYYTVKVVEFGAVPSPVLWGLRIAPFVLCLILIGGITSLMNENDQLNQDEIVAAYYGHLDFREYDKAYALLNTNISYPQYLRDQLLRGGLLPSYGKLTKVRIIEVSPEHAEMELIYLTALGYKSVNVTHAFRDGKIIYETDKAIFDLTIVDQDTTDEFLDKTSRQTIRPGQEPVAKLQRPRISSSEATLFEQDGRYFVSGQLSNRSPFPACVQLKANALDKNGNIMATQNMGRLGAHRLSPGGSSPFLVGFEGFLKIPDADFNTVYDPDQFSVPEFLEAPVDISIDVQSTVCSVSFYQSIQIADVRFDGKFLSLNLKNHGTKIVNTLQLKIAHRNGDMQVALPFYIQESLRPGELRKVSVKIDPIPAVISKTRTLNINGMESLATDSFQEQFVFGDDIFDIAYDAMTYEIQR